MYFCRIINNKTIKKKIINKTTSDTNPYEEVHVFVKQKKTRAQHLQNKTKSVHNASDIAVYWILAEISPGQRKTNSTVCE